MAELGVGYISIVPSMQGARKTIASELKGVEVLGDTTGKNLGSRISTGMGGILKKSAIGVGASAGAAIGVGITKGLGRLNSIEQAEAKLRGLGNSAQTVEQVMSNALASVKGTSFGLEEAATTAAGAVASGIKPGEELEQVLKTVGDTATIAGTSMSEMGKIFGSVMARGKLQGDDLLQLTSRGIPVLQMIGDELGKTSEEISDMVSKGQIDFKSFESALRKGVGGAALEAGQTVQGAMRNMGAAMGRLGATIAGPFFNQAAKGFGGVTDLLDSMNAKVKPTMEELDQWLKSPAAQQWGQRIQQAAVSAAAFGKDLYAATLGSKSFQSMLEAVWQLASAAAPAVAKLGHALAEASAALGVSTWQVFTTAVEATAKVLNATVVPVLDAVATLAENNTGAVAALLGAWMAWKTIPSVLKPASAAFEGLKTSMSTVKDFKAYAAATGEEVSNLGASFMALGTSSNKGAAMFGQAAANGSAKLQALARSHQQAAVAAKAQVMASRDVGTTVTAMFQQVGHSGVASMATLGAAAKGAAAGGISVLKTSISGLVGAMGGPLGAGIVGVTMLLGSQKAAADAAKRAHEAVAEAVHAGADAQNELKLKLAGSTGELKDNAEAMSAAATVVKGSLADFVEMGSRQRGVIENLSEATVAVDELVNKIPGFASESAKAATQATRDSKNLNESYQELEKQASELDIPMSKLNEVVAEGGPKFQQLMANLRDSGDVGNRAADQLQQARDKIQSIQDVAKNTSPAFMEAAKGMEELSDAAGSTGNKLDALESTMQALGLAPKDAQQAMMDAAESVDELSKKIDGLVDASAPVGDALFDMSGNLEPTNANARALSETMNGMRQQLLNVANNGGDVTKAFAMMQPNLQQLQSEFGLTDQQMGQLIQTFGLVPNKVEALVNVNGVDQSTRDVLAVVGALKEVPEGESVQVNALTDEAVAKLEQLGIKAEEVKGADGEANAMRITADTTDAMAKLEQFAWASAELESKNINPSVLLNTEPARIEGANVQAMLDGLNIQRPSPQANLLIERLVGQKQIAVGELAALAAESPTPTADLNKVLLDAGVDQATIDLMGLDSKAVTSKSDLDKDEFQAKSDKVNEELDKLDKKTAKPKIDPDTDQAQREIQSVRDDLGSLKDRDIRVRVHYSSIGSRPSTAGATGGRYIADRFRYAHGGRHDGYRLPHTGPGTEVVDGFTAIDSHGMAIARLDKDEWVINRRSSEKYDKELAQINAGTFPKLPGYAEGGRAGVERALAEAKSSHDRGATYVWGGTARDGADCSGFVGRAAWAAEGKDPDTAGRMGTTHTMLAGQWPGFSRGVHGPFVVGVNAEHMAATIDGVPVESGGDVGGPSVGEGDGAFDPQFTEHWSMDADAFSPPYDESAKDQTVTDHTGDAGEASQYDTTGASYGTSAPSYQDEPQRWSDRVGEQIGEGTKQWIKGTSSAYIADALGVFGLSDEMPSYVKAGFQLKSALADREEKAKAEQETTTATTGESTNTTKTPTSTTVPNGAGDVGVKYDPVGGADQWLPVVQDALRRTGRSEADADRTLEQIKIESGGDPNATGPDSPDGAPRGLLQVKPGTFAANRDPELPDDVTHPLANVVAAIKYATGRYGSLAEVWPTAAGYATGGWVDMLKPKPGDSDTSPAWLTPGEFVVNKDAAQQHGSLLEAMNSGLIDQAPQVAREITKASSYAVLSTGVGAAQSGLGMLATVPGMVPVATTGNALLGAGGGLIAEMGSDLAAEVVGQFADAGVRMANAGEQTLRAKLPEFVPPPAREAVGRVQQVTNQLAPQQVSSTNESAQFNVHFHVADFSDAMRRSQAEMAQYARTFA